MATLARPRDQERRSIGAGAALAGADTSGGGGIRGVSRAAPPHANGARPRTAVDEARSASRIHGAIVRIMPARAGPGVVYLARVIRRRLLVRLSTASLGGFGAAACAGTLAQVDHNPAARLDSRVDAGPAAADAPPPQAEAGMAGLDAPDLDAAMVARLGAVMKCTELERCEAFAAWKAADVTTPAAARTLVTMLAHPDARVRDLAASTLSDVPLDDALAERALAAIATERAEHLATRMGELGVSIAKAHPALAERVDALVHSHPLDDLRKALAWGVTFEACCGGEQLKMGPSCVAGLVRDGDAAVRGWASDAAGACLYVGDKPLTTLQCGGLFALLDAPDAELAGKTAARIVDACPAMRGCILGKAQARSGTPWRGVALTAFCAIPSTTTAAERLQAVTLAARFARDRSYDVEARGAALTAVGVCVVNAGSDPAGYAALYARLQREVEAAVIEHQGHIGIDDGPHHGHP